MSIGPERASNTPHAQTGKAMNSVKEAGKRTTRWWWLHAKTAMASWSASPRQNRAWQKALRCLKFKEPKASFFITSTASSYVSLGIRNIQSSVRENATLQYLATGRGIPKECWVHPTRWFSVGLSTPQERRADLPRCFGLQIH